MVLSIPFQRVYSAIRLEQQRTQGYTELRDMLYVLSGSFASGSGLKEGIRECSKMLDATYGDHSLFQKNTGYMVRAIEEGNASEMDLFQGFVRSTGFPELKQVYAVYVLCIRTGGDLPKAMIETSDSMLRRLQLWQEIRSRTSQKRLEFSVMSAMIPLLLACINGASDYLSPLYGEPAGRWVMTAALILLMAAFLWSTRILEGGKR